jgi:hypothetical protein
MRSRTGAASSPSTGTRTGAASSPSTGTRTGAEKPHRFNAAQVAEQPSTGSDRIPAQVRPYRGAQVRRLDSGTPTR